MTPMTMIKMQSFHILERTLLSDMELLKR